VGLCTKHYHSAYYVANRARERARQRERNHGIAAEEYETMLAAQGGVCAICKKPPGRRMLNVDHDHTTGAIRALLCHGCNTGLGAFKDTPATLRAAAAYLEKHHGD
jgi:hypothetical protein